jgi:hypothetical protein
MLVWGELLLTKVRIFPNKKFRVGDLVSRDSESPLQAYCIIGFKEGEGGDHLAVLKGLFGYSRIAEAPLQELTNLIVKGKL